MGFGARWWVAHGDGRFPPCAHCWEVWGCAGSQRCPWKESTAGVIPHHGHTGDPSSVGSRGNSRAKDTGGGWSQPASLSPPCARIKGAAGAGGTRRHIMETEFLLKKEKAQLCQNAQHSAHTLA